MTGIHLAPREQQILDFLTQGYEGPQIEAELFVSASTVKTWKSDLHAKLGARTAAQAVHLAYQAGLLGSAIAEDLALVRQANEMGYRIALAPLAGGAR